MWSVYQLSRCFLRTIPSQATCWDSIIYGPNILSSMSLGKTKSPGIQHNQPRCLLDAFEYPPRDSLGDWLPGFYSHGRLFCHSFAAPFVFVVVTEPAITKSLPNKPEADLLIQGYTAWRYIKRRRTPVVDPLVESVTRKIDSAGESGTNPCLFPTCGRRNQTAAAPRSCLSMASPTFSSQARSSTEPS